MSVLAAGSGAASVMRSLAKKNAFFEALVGRTDLVWMGQNTTHLELPPEVMDAIEASITGREFQVYAPPLGLEELRRLVREDLGLPDMEVLITDGAVSGLYHVCKTLGAEVSSLVTTDPGWPWPAKFVEALGKPSVAIDIFDARSGYKLSLDALRERLARRSLIYLIDPLNPLGSTYTADELRAICGLARANECYLIHDCTYRHFAEAHTLAAQYYPERTITTYSFSKWLGLAGFRIGAVVAPPEIVAKLADAPPNCLGSNIVAQRAAIAGLRVGQRWLAALRALNRDNQAIVERAVVQSGLGQVLVHPSAGNFMAIGLDGSGWTGDEFAAAMLERGVFIRSGTYQSRTAGQRFVKISTSVPAEWAARCAAAIAAVAHSHSSHRAGHTVI